MDTPHRGGKGMTKAVLMIGTFDSKGEEFAFLRQQLLEDGVSVLAMNVGVLGTTERFPVEVEAGTVAEAAGTSLDALRADKDRGAAMKAMGAGAPVVAARLYAEGRIAGVIGMGGSGGTSIVCAALRALPIGVPKICVSTVAGGDVSAYVGAKDIVMMPSIVDVAGLNRLSRLVMTRAAGAMAGMVNAPVAASAEDRPVIAASMFGNTTECVTACAAQLDARGYEVLTFHAVGTGGRTMEALVDDGFVQGVLDITTTEWADEICGGVFSAGPDRLSAPGRRGIPHLIVPGCVDMANFGGPETVPCKYRDAGRIFYEWNPSVTLMRTNADENREMGRIFAEKANAASGPVMFLFPLRGVSILDGEGQLFCDWETDLVLFDTLRAHLRPGIRVETMDCNINAPEFAARAVELMLELMSSPT